MEDHELRDTGASSQLSAKSSKVPLKNIPAPRNRAAVDSFLNSFADDDVPAATAATFVTASDADGAMTIVNRERRRERNLTRDQGEKNGRKVMEEYQRMQEFAV